MEEPATCSPAPPALYQNTPISVLPRTPRCRRRTVDQPMPRATPVSAAGPSARRRSPGSRPWWFPARRGRQRSGKHPRPMLPVAAPRPRARQPFRRHLAPSPRLHGRVSKPCPCGARRARLRPLGGPPIGRGPAAQRPLQRRLCLPYNGRRTATPWPQPLLPAATNARPKTPPRWSRSSAPRCKGLRRTGSSGSRLFVLQQKSRSGAQTRFGRVLMGPSVGATQQWSSICSPLI